MKRIISLMLLAIISLSFMGCTNKTNEGKSKVTEEEVKIEKESSDDNKLEEKEKEIEEDKKETEEISEENNEFTVINDATTLVDEVYKFYYIFKGNGAEDLIGDNEVVDGYALVKEEWLKKYKGWEFYIKGVFNEEIAEELLSKDLIIDRDGYTYVMSGHVPLYVEWEMPEGYKDTIKIKDNIVEVTVNYIEDGNEGRIKEEVLTIEYEETDNGLIVTGGSFVDLFR